MSHPIRIAPSILSADFAALGEAVELIEHEADLLHVDVMDGHFVPNLTIGPPVVKSLRRHTAMRLDCHLMITDPWDYLDAFAKAGADSCTVHVEVGRTRELIAQARGLGLGVGLSANPGTSLDAVEPFLAEIDLVLLMTVNPGFGGQSFMREVVPKIRRARAAIDAGGHDVVIQVDGGIDAETAPVVVDAGATVLVAGSAIFGDDDPASAARRIREAAESTLARSR